MNSFVKTVLPALATVGLLVPACSSTDRHFAQVDGRDSQSGAGAGAHSIATASSQSGGSTNSNASVRDDNAGEGGAGEEGGTAGMRVDEPHQAGAAPLSVGGQNTGGQNTGGQNTGGQSTGGQNTGGQNTGGQVGTAGSAGSAGSNTAGGGGNCADLTSDAQNCGRCGHSCLGGACQAGVCQPVALAVGQVNPMSLSVVGPYVYFTRLGDSTSGQGGAVMRVPVTGGTPIEVATSQNKAYGLALDGSNAYWSSAVSGGIIQKLALTGGTPATLAGAANSPQIAVSNGSLFFQDCPTSGAYCSTIRRIPVSGGTSEAIGSGSIQGFLAINSTYLYWATPTTVNRVALNGSASTAIVTSQSNVNGIAADETNLFWANLANGGSIMKANLDGTGAVQLATGPGAANALTVDQSAVYWTENGIVNQRPSVLSMVPRAGGTAQQLYSIPRASGSCTSPRTDDQAVYWAVNGMESSTTGAIMKLAKP